MTNRQISIYDYFEEDNYAIGIMFRDFRHHEIDGGKPTTKLLSLDGKHLDWDAHLLFPTKDGIVITEYKKGEMIGYCHIKLDKNNELIEVEHTPYGNLIKCKNHIEIPNNILNMFIEHIGTTNDTWFMFKAIMNSNNLLDSNTYIVPTLTTKQDRIPNSGMVIEYAT